MAEVNPPDERLVRGILIVDDKQANLLAIEAALGDLAHGAVYAQSGAEALHLLLDRDFALILLDVKMPSMDGFETAKLVRERKRSRHTPIIFVTAYGRDERDITAAYELGAVDFLFKPIEPAVLLALEEERRRWNEESMRRRVEELAETDRRKDEVLAMLGHELRSPLAPIVSMNDV